MNRLKIFIKGLADNLNVFSDWIKEIKNNFGDFN